MKKVWFEEAWEDYTYWQTQDKKTLKRINTLLKDIERGNFDGIGKPEPLKGELMKPTDSYIASAMVYWKSCHAGDIMTIE